jgi:hypothetical protein
MYMYISEADRNPAAHVTTCPVHHFRRTISRPPFRLVCIFACGIVCTVWQVSNLARGVRSVTTSLTLHRELMWWWRRAVPSCEHIRGNAFTVMQLHPSVGPCRSSDCASGTSIKSSAFLQNCSEILVGERSVGPRRGSTKGVSVLYCFMALRVCHLSWNCILLFICELELS